MRVRSMDSAITCQCTKASYLYQPDRSVGTVAATVVDKLKRSGYTNLILSRETEPLAVYGNLEAFAPDLELAIGRLTKSDDPAAIVNKGRLLQMALDLVNEQVDFVEFWGDSITKRACGPAGLGVTEGNPDVSPAGGRQSHLALIRLDERPANPDESTLAVRTVRIDIQPDKLLVAIDVPIHVQVENGKNGSDVPDESTPGKLTIEAVITSAGKKNERSYDVQASASLVLNRPDVSVYRQLNDGHLTVKERFEICAEQFDMWTGDVRQRLANLFAVIVRLLNMLRAGKRPDGEVPGREPSPLMLDPAPEDNWDTVSIDDKVGDAGSRVPRSASTEW